MFIKKKRVNTELENFKNIFRQSFINEINRIHEESKEPIYLVCFHKQMYYLELFKDTLEAKSTKKQDAEAWARCIVCFEPNTMKLLGIK
jgi:hypothetical protein